MSDAAKPLEVFYSYSHKDEDLRQKLNNHLSILKATGVITEWHDRNINAGTDWEKQINQHLDSADIILLLISSDFLASRYCYSIEMDRALERERARKATVIPVILRAVDWEDARFGYLQALPTNAEPITSWDNEDEAFRDVARGIRKAAKALRPKHISSSVIPSGGTTSVPITPPVQSRVWTVPHPRNRNFTGRKALLKDLRKKLTSGQPAALTQAIHGLGGVGKTQLANEYAYRHASDYDAVLWVRAEESTTLAADFAALAGELSVSEPDTRDQDADVKAVLRWLREHTRWLLVFDNAEEGRQIAKYLPQVGTGHVLITSRNPNWREYAQPVVVEVMEPEDAVDFLLKRTGEKDRATAGKLAEELGFLPIALAQAGAYMEQKQKSLPDYLSLFQEYRDKVLTPSDDYPLSIAATWELSFQAVRAHSPAAADLLNLCAFFAPEDIPLDMIVAGAKHLPDSLKNAVLEPLELDDMVGELGKYSLVEVDKERRTISSHRLVQEVVRDKLSSEERQMWAEAALQIVNSGFSYKKNDLSTWPIAAMVLPHALAVITLPDLRKPDSKEVSELLSYLLSDIGLYLLHRAQYGEARNQLERALTIDEAVYGPDDSKVAADLGNLGKVLNALGDLQGARFNLERALTIDEAVYGPNHPHVATSLNELGRVLHDLGDLQGARSNLEKALAIYEAVYGPNHPHVAVGLSNLGGILQDLGDLQGARSNFERALAIDEAVYGPDHPEVATVLGNLGGIFKYLGDLVRARSNFERALALYQASYGPQHPYVATALINLGIIFKDLGDLVRARSNYERALAIDEAVYGPDHPEVATDLNNLAQLLWQQGNLRVAQEYLERSNKILRKYLGVAHPNTVSTQKSLETIARLLEQTRK
jgi:tetratricopeptide (TPR) repeat protein